MSIEGRGRKVLVGHKTRRGEVTRAGRGVRKDKGGICETWQARGVCEGPTPWSSQLVLSLLTFLPALGLHVSSATYYCGSLSIE